MTLGRVFMALVLIVGVSLTTPARADERVDHIAAGLSSSSEKTRISAVAALAKIGDKRALKPLVGALKDSSATVRALAAGALGTLGHRACLPALRGLASDDPDPTVRARAREAAQLVAKANDEPDGLPRDTSAAAVPARTQRGRTSGFGHSPHAVESRPDLYVDVKSTRDDSPGKADKATRQIHADVLRRTLADSLHAAPQVTTVAADAQRWGLEARHLDVAVTKCEVTRNGGMVEVAADLRLAISDDRGKMLSFLSGGARVQVPSGKFDARYLPQLRREALEQAMRGLFEKLIVHLRQTSQS
jgi:hypothetical protein